MMLGQSISRNSVLLGFFALATTAIIAGTHLATKSTIKDNIRKAEERALLEIIPADRHNNSMLDDTYTVSNSEQLGLREEKNIYIARQDQKPVAVIIPATARDGYTGDIDIIVGINIDGTVAGVRVLSHRETPGLGDRIETKKSDWVFGFEGKSLTRPETALWTVKKDKGVFDQFTGATITPRAIVKTVHRTLQYFEEHRYNILPASKVTQDNAIKKNKEKTNG